MIIRLNIRDAVATTSSGSPPHTSTSPCVYEDLIGEHSCPCRKASAPLHRQSLLSHHPLHSIRRGDPILNIPTSKLHITNFHNLRTRFSFSQSSQLGTQCSIRGNTHSYSNRSAPQFKLSQLPTVTQQSEPQPRLSANPSSKLPISTTTCSNQ